MEKAVEKLRGYVNAEVSGAETDPFGAELAEFVQQRHEVARYGRYTSGTFYTHNKLRGNIDKSQLHIAGNGAFVENIVQHRWERVFAMADGVSVVFLALL